MSNVVYNGIYLICLMILMVCL